MTVIHESDFIKIQYFEDKALFEFTFSDLSDMSGDVFKKELDKQAELAESYNPLRFLFHSKNFNFSITPDIQKWTDEHIFPRYVKAGVKKFAYIFSSDFISQLSIEQVMEEQKAQEGFQTRYFDSEDKAREWLMAD